MSGKNIKTKKQTKTPANKSKRAAEIFLAIFAVLLILSMVLAAVSKF